MQYLMIFVVMHQFCYQYRQYADSIVVIAYTFTSCE